MADGAARESKIVATYRARTRRAAELYRRAREVLPGGIVHESRRMWPYGVYGDRALGSRKWDVDGNEYVDYYGGHGSLLLGHQHPAVLEAIERQLRKGMHLAAAHEHATHAWIGRGRVETPRGKLERPSHVSEVSVAEHGSKTDHKEAAKLGGPSWSSDEQEEALRTQRCARVSVSFPSRPWCPSWSKTL